MRALTTMLACSHQLEGRLQFAQMLCQHCAPHPTPYQLASQGAQQPC